MRLGGVGVEGEVILLGAFEEAVEVGFVPDFEVPGFDFVVAVAFLEVGDEGGDEGSAHFLGSLGWVMLPLPPEDGLGAAGEGVGAEAESSTKGFMWMDWRKSY